MLLHQLAGFINITGFICLKNQLMHMSDIVLRFGLSLIQIRKNRKLSAKLLCSEKGKHPIVMYPGECYYCGACVMVCPNPGAIHLQHPVMNRAKFVPVKEEP